MSDDELLKSIRLEMREKAAPARADSPGYSGGVDAYRRVREPSPEDMLRELKGTAFACVSINASTCASYPPKLYVLTRPGEPSPKCRTTGKAVPAGIASAEGRVEEVADHPILRLLARANSEHNGYDLLELTTAYQEVHGRAFWLLERDALGVPQSVWPLPTHLVKRRRDGAGYEYCGTSPATPLPSDDLVVFRYPDPRDPYHGGLSPLRAAFEQASLDSEFMAFKGALWRNSGLPGVVISPKEVFGEAERLRLEAEWRERFTRGGQGRVLVSDDAADVKVIEQSLGDLALIAEQAFSKEQIANAFGVPLPFLTKETNLANLAGAHRQHAALAIRPRLRRRDEKLNERLVPLFDGSGRLFLRSDDPVQEDEESARAWMQAELQNGVRTVNEYRLMRGLQPVPWGETPWLPLTWAPTDFARRSSYAPGTGRNSDPARLEQDTTTEGDPTDA